MVLVSADHGSAVMDGTEIVLFSDSVDTLQYNMTYIYLDPMTSVTPDVITIKVYIWDNIAGSFKSYNTKQLTGQQTPDSVYYVPPLPTHRLKVTIQQTAGTNRTFNWERLTN